MENGRDAGRPLPLTADQEAAYLAWTELIERDDYEPSPSGTGIALEGDEAAAYSRALLDELEVMETPDE